MKLTFLDIVKYDDHMWISVLGVECGDFDGHLLHLEYDMGDWKWGLLWLRPLAMKLRGF